MLKKLSETPSQTAGPFLHIGCTPAAIDINVFKYEIGLAPFRDISFDEVINIKGRIFDGNNDPVLDAMIETWQCDSSGKYFGHQGFARKTTDFETGDYFIKTIKPGSNNDNKGSQISSYISFWIVARGMNRPLITRMYFDKEGLENDKIFKGYNIKKRLNTLLPQTKDDKNFIFDIHLQGKKETIFFEF